MQIQQNLEDAYKNNIYVSIPANYIEANPIKGIILEKMLWTENDKSIFNNTKKNASSIPMLLEKIDEAISEISDDYNDEQIIWYRGQKDSSYLLIPSLYRMKDQKEKFYNSNLRTVFEALYDGFKVRSFGTTEIYHDGNNSVMGVMTSMQHYCVPTNILDWTLSAFVAMYFAVEDTIIKIKKGNKKTENDKDAIIWLLNPIRLNQANEFLRSSVSNACNHDKLKEYPLPSLLGNESKYIEYIPFSGSKESKIEYPIAVNAPFVNPRVKSQLGTFTMFSLDVEGDPGKKANERIFKKYDLFSLQEEYRNKIEPTGMNYKKFLTGVVIKGSCRYDLAKWLIKMGMDKPNIYPELTNISQSLTEQLRKYYESL